MSIKCSSTSSSSCMVVCFFTMLCLSHFVTLEEIPVCQDVTDFTPQSCCPCFRNELCGVACPGDYLTIKPASTVSCKMNSSAPAYTTTSSSQITTELTMASENTTQSSSAVNVTDNNYVVCLLSCPVNSYYDNSTKQCLKCDDTCLNCAWPDGKDCTVCKFLYNGTCFSMCPENTVASTNETQDGAKLCETKPPYNGTNQLPIGVIAGGAGGAGGVVVITIIIIILVCYCRRRGRSKTDATEKRAMSVILEQQQSADRNGKEEARKRTDRLHVNYENTLTTLPHPIDIERQGDTILRYTRDPTFKDTNKKDERNRDDVDSIYANAAMIRLASNTDLSHVKDSELTDKLEIEEIGIAPSAPVNKPVHTATKRHAPRSVPNSAEQTLPQPVATESKQKKLKRTVNARLTKPHIHAPDDYIDMSHGAMAAGPASAPASDLEAYENFSFSEIPQGRRGQKTSAHKKTSPEVGMEIYANTHVDDHGNSEGDNSDLEDYENTKEYRKQSEGPIEKENDDLEDHEIMNDLYENYTSPQFQQK